MKGNRTPDVQLKASQRTALEAFARCAKYLSTRDLVEEFVAAGVWPLSRDWSIPKFGDKGPKGLCRPHPALQGFTGIIFITFLIASWLSFAYTSYSVLDLTVAKVEAKTMMLLGKFTQGEA